MDLLVVVIIALLTSFANILFPLPGYAFLTPIFLHFYPPNEVIGLLAFYFGLSALARMLVFYRAIRWNEALFLIPTTILGASLAAYFSKFIPDTILLILLIGGSLFLLAKKVFPRYFPSNRAKPRGYYSALLVGGVSGFFQSLGLGGSLLRGSYLVSRGLGMQEFHATTAVIAVFSLFPAAGIRVSSGVVTLQALLPFFYCFPLILFATYLGKLIIVRFPPAVGEKIIIAALLLSLLGLVPKLL